jgi:hypothetical protein
MPEIESFLYSFSLYQSFSLNLFSGGFFIEAGSNDGEILSDSLHFELNHNWKVRKNQLLCPFALYYVPNRFMPNFQISRISLVSGQ